MAGTILIVGSAGFIGGYVSRKLCDLGWEVIGVDNMTVYKPNEYDLYSKHYSIRSATQLNDLAASYRIDASQSPELAELLQRHKPNVVLNIGGSSVADVAKNNITEAVTSIYGLNANILQNIRDLHFVQRYVYISSSMVYGDFTADPQPEDAAKQPKDPYGATKLGAEHLIRSFHEQFGTQYTIVRPSAVYGPLDSNMRVTGIFIRNASLGKPLRVNDVTEALDFTYVEDTADGIVRACTHPAAANESFNITRGDAQTIERFAIEVGKHYPEIGVIYGADAEHMAGLDRPKRGSLDINKAKALIGYEPRYSIDEGVAKYVAAWREFFGDARPTLQA